MALSRNYFNPIFSTSVITVEPVIGSLTQQLTVTWPRVPNAIGYNVHAGNTPRFKSNVVNPALLTTTTYVLAATRSAPDIVVHVWVEAVFPFSAQLLQDLGATVYDRQDAFDKSPLNPEGYGLTVDIDNDYMTYIRDEIRRRNKTMLENDAEEMTIYMKRWRGTPCQCNKLANSLVQGNDPDIDADPDYNNSPGRCTQCFGTGIYGGFWPGIDLLIRYGNLPRRMIKYTSQGLDLEHDFDSWTLWLPKLHKHDLVVRKSDGQRFIIDGIGQSEWRNIPLHQEMRLLNLQSGDTRELVSDSTIASADAARIAAGYSDPGF